MTLTRRAIATVGCLLAAGMLAGCGEATVGTARSATKAAAKADPTGATITTAVATSPGKSGTPGVAKEVADPLEADSYPTTGSVHHSAAKAPVKAGEAIVAAGAPSDAEVRKELQQMQAVERSARRSQARTLTAVPGGESIGGNGTIPIPSGVPEVIQKVVAGANEIADFPYVYGGGHASFIDNAYDCSGSVSYALAAGGLLGAPETSGQLESWGAPGPGKYITVYANAGHTYMYVDGMLYDTAGRSGVYASRWQVQPTNNEGYVVRHWPGL
jgi:cell wall-associated NlpC family hydrolase